MEEGGKGGGAESEVPRTKPDLFRTVQRGGHKNRDGPPVSMVTRGRCDSDVTAPPLPIPPPRLLPALLSKAR